MRAAFTARVVAAVFVAAIALPLAATLAGVAGADAAAENRELAAFPRVAATPQAIARFPSGLDAWFADHFAFRSMLVGWYGRLQYFGLRTSPSTHG